MRRNKFYTIVIIDNFGGKRVRRRLKNNYLDGLAKLLVVDCVKSQIMIAHTCSQSTWRWICWYHVPDTKNNILNDISFSWYIFSMSLVYWVSVMLSYSNGFSAASSSIRNPSTSSAPASFHVVNEELDSDVVENETIC